MKKIKVDIWKLMFWLGVITLFIWLLLKIIGVINTTLIIQLIPFLSAIAIIFGAIKHVGKFIHRVENGLSDIKDLKDKTGKLEKTIETIKFEIHSIDKRVAFIEYRI